jgi:hypothetical protein
MKTQIRICLTVEFNANSSFSGLLLPKKSTGACQTRLPDAEADESLQLLDDNYEGRFQVLMGLLNPQQKACLSQVVRFYSLGGGFRVAKTESRCDFRVTGGELRRKGLFLEKKA